MQINKHPIHQHPLVDRVNLSYLEDFYSCFLFPRFALISKFKLRFSQNLTYGQSETERRFRITKMVMMEAVAGDGRGESKQMNEKEIF